ncbi:FxSxx-COOH system tetratricopeptide repeat protein [Streptomyces jeddahensis]|uniref:NB-ARC domain protein n=1 Tax=Streptomyces jeddahensis TaxID=1716141 RepID=A0A177HSR9_9ACTN|nr:FxSxx-COOH system tetratricopeptide repeat protein [Streptomyces jeddahensis]OAH13517.1 NB-ARC domain protein [Streptomyces jeddahensis]
MPAERRVQARRGDAVEKITISFAGFNRAWAAWIGDRLERRGFSVSYRLWESPADQPLIELLQDLATAPGRVLLVLSEWYFRLGPRTDTEWNSALREVVLPVRDHFTAVSVTHSRVPSATAMFGAPQLNNIGADEAEARLLRHLGIPADGPPQAVDGRRGPRFPSEAPDVWGYVPRRNPRFTGRETLLGGVYDTLNGASGGAAVAALHGPPGVGKTQLAAEYAHRFGSEYDVVWWISADRRGACRQRLAELAPELGLTTGVEYGERLRAARHALRRGDPYSRWLVIMDGADEPDQVWDLVPEGRGHVLITSRNRDWNRYSSQLVEVGPYDRIESIAFVRRRAPRLSHQDAERLAEALEDLPLLLDQTAAWLAESDMTIDAYLELLEEGAGQDVVTVSSDFPVAFRTAWAILLNHLRETLPESVDLLRMCTLFRPTSIPIRLVRELPREALPEKLVGLVESPVRWARAVEQLKRYAVVRAAALDDPTGGDPSDQAGLVENLTMHRLVHLIVHQDMPEQDHREFTEAARRALAASDPLRPTDPGLWPRYAEIVPHLKTADVLHSTDPDVQRLVLNCLRYMYLSGEYRPGIVLAERALETWRSLLGEEHPRIWDVIYHYANLLRAVGDYARTEAIERKVVETLREQRGPDDLEHIQAADGLAADLRGLGRYDEAYTISTWVLDAYERLLGEGDSRTQNARNNLAVSLRLLGRYEEALALHRQTMEERRQYLNPRHNWTLYAEVHYATDLRLLGRYAEAVSLQGQNVRVHRQVMGDDNPQTLQAEHNLALCHYRSGDWREAGEMLAGVLERSERVLGDDHPLTLMFATSQSFFAREHGDVDLARRLGESVAAHYARMLGPDHPFAQGVRCNNALILRSVGERDQALETVEAALGGMRRAVGKRHPWTLGCAVNASGIRNLTGDPASAATLSLGTAETAAEVLGDRHPLTLTARIALAADLRGTGENRQADKIEREALDALAQSLGERHVHTVSARSRTRPYWDFEPQII